MSYHVTYSPLLTPSLLGTMQTIGLDDVEVMSQMVRHAELEQRDHAGKLPRAQAVPPMLQVSTALMSPATHRVSVGVHTDGAADPGASEGLGARSLVKQVRDRVVSNGRDRLGRIVEEAVGVRLVSVHHDISTVTGEEVLVFSLAAAPACQTKR